MPTSSILPKPSKPSHFSLFQQKYIPNSNPTQNRRFHPPRSPPLGRTSLSTKMHRSQTSHERSRRDQRRLSRQKGQAEQGNHETTIGESIPFGTIGGPNGGTSKRFRGEPESTSYGIHDFFFSTVAFWFFGKDDEDDQRGWMGADGLNE